MAAEAKLAKEKAYLYDAVIKTEDFVEKKISLIIDIGSIKSQ